MNDNYIIIYAIMPSEIYKTKDLTSEEKLIAERITALCKKEGYAWISNKALADMYGIRADTVSKHIRHLIRYGYLKCLYGKNDNGHKKRTIYLANSIWDNQAIVNSLNNQSNIGYTSKYNNKYTYKDNNKTNNITIYNKLAPNGNPMFGTKDGIDYWKGEPVKREEATPEEQAEMQREINEICGDTHE
jgi:ribosomal protein S25